VVPSVEALHILTFITLLCPGIVGGKVTVDSVKYMPSGFAVDLLLVALEKETKKHSDY